MLGDCVTGLFGQTGGDLTAAGVLCMTDTWWHFGATGAAGGGGGGNLGSTSGLVTASSSTLIEGGSHCRWVTCKLSLLPYGILSPSDVDMNRLFGGGFQSGDGGHIIGVGASIDTVGLTRWFGDSALFRDCRSKPLTRSTSSSSSCSRSLLATFFSVIHKQKLV